MIADAESIIGAKLTSFHIAPSRVVHLTFLQCQPEQLIARPERLCTQVWLIRPKRIVIKLTKQDRQLVSVRIDRSPEGAATIWSFGDDEILSAGCGSVSIVFFPVVTWIC